jgi:hypothetical protein
MDQPMSYSWLVLHYQLAREPSAPRVSAWRKLKKLGAVLLNDTFWVLPENDRTREQFRWLAADIVAHKGQAFVWAGSSVLLGQDQTLEDLFLQQVEPLYHSILEALAEKARGDDPDLVALSKQFQTAQSLDHLKSALGKTVRKALERAKEHL